MALASGVGRRGASIHGTMPLTRTVCSLQVHTDSVHALWSCSNKHSTCHACEAFCKVEKRLCSFGGRSYTHYMGSLTLSRHAQE